MPHSEIIVFGGSCGRDAYDQIVKAVADVGGGYSSIMGVLCSSVVTL